MKSSSFVPRILEDVESIWRHAGGLLALRGAIAVVFGVIALRRPDVAAYTLALVFAVYVFADAFLDFVLAERFGRAGMRWGWYVFAGLASIALGVVAISVPRLTVVILVLLVGLRAIVFGTFELVTAISWGPRESRWMLGLAGVLSLTLGIMLLASTVAGPAAAMWTIGIYAISYGVALFALGIRVLAEARHVREELPGPGAGPAVPST